MAEKTTKKNTKGTKKVVKKETTKKVATKKAAPKKVTPKKVTPKKVVKSEVTVTKEEVKNAKVVAPKTTKKEGKVKAVFDKIMANKPFAITLCISIILAGALIFTLCAKRIPKTKDGKQILASVKGKNFTADDLYIALKDEYGTEKLISMIDEYITGKEVKFTKENEKYIQDIVDSWKAQAESYGMTLPDLVANYGLRINNDDEFYDYLKKSYSISLAVEKFIGDQASEKDLKEYYKNNYSDTLTVRHILIEVDNSDDESEIEARNKAMDLIKELDDTDKSKLEDKFIELAKENSDDTGSYSNGGLIENVTKTSVVSEFFDASSKLKDGEYTKEPVKSTYGYHIIYRISSTPVEDFKKIKDEVKSAYAKELLNADPTLQVTKWDELRKSYKMKINDTDVKKYYEDNITVQKRLNL